MFVRHPFARLVSAYRDKVVRTNWRNFQTRIRKDLIKLPHDQRQPPGMPTFGEFADFILSGNCTNDRL